MARSFLLLLVRPCNQIYKTTSSGILSTMLYPLRFQCASPHIDNTSFRTLATKRSRKRASTDYDDLKSNDHKSILISQMNFLNARDAAPFFKLPIKTLVHISRVTNKDETEGNCKNRLYFLAEHMKVAPSVLSDHLARRTFIYGLSFNWLKSSLHVLLEMGVSSDRILRDLWTLKYHHKTIQDRLQRVKDLGIKVLYPWMVRCSENILNRYVAIAHETKNILGDSESTQIYLANRLKISPEDIEDLCFKIPALKTIRVTKVKNFLDFLLNEGFEVDDIANKPRVLTASQKTVTLRLEKLRKLGLSQINLNVLCRSRKDFKKYCDSLKSSKSCSNFNI